MNFKNFKIVRKLKDLSPKLKWTMFSQFQDYKIGSRYIDYLIPEDKKDINKDNEKLEKMVRDTLIKEFSPKIKDFISFNLLVDVTVHRIKEKQLRSMCDWEDIEL